MKRTRTISAWLVAWLFVGLISASFTCPSFAQSANEARTSHPVSFGYDKTHEIAVEGNIQEVVSKHRVGSPVGIHVLVAGAHGTVDAHLGPYVSKEIQDALHLGTPVQVVGATEVVKGKSYLLVRQLTVGGQTVTVRTERGFLVRTNSARPQQTRTDKQSRVETARGAR